MYQTIDEEITVIGTYQKNHFLPKKMLWRGETFEIEQICSEHNFRDGLVRKRRFSILSKKNLYLIEFNRDAESWRLEQVWVE